MRTARGRVLSALLVTTLAAGALFLSAGTSSASFHLVKIREIFPGTEEDPGAQFIELQMYSGGQGFVSGIEVEVFDAAGTSAGTFTFSQNVPNGSNQSSILVATDSAQELFDKDADLDMSPVIDTVGGKVCYGGTVDCASWGSFSGSNGGTGTPFAASTGLVLGSSMERDISRGDPTKLEGPDDTNDSAADFKSAAPSPTNNTGASASPSPTVSPSPTPTKPPADRTAPRSVIDKPKDAATYGPAELNTFRGSASDRGSGVARIHLALKKQLVNGKCRWYSGDHFVRRACSQKLWFRAEHRTDWRADAPRLTSSRGTDTSFYVLYSRATDEAGNKESHFDRARNENRFEID